MKMTVVDRVFVVLAVVMTARVLMCFPTSEEEKINMSNLKKENELRNKFKCGPPQPRMVYLHEIVGDEVWKTNYTNKMKHILPYGVVLHRCENSGCCKNYNERCKPANETEVTQTFMIIENSYKYYTVNYQAKNHTLCSCQIISDELIK